MKDLFYYIIFGFVLLFNSYDAKAQQFRLLGNTDSYTTSFKLINNLIVLPLEINGSKLTFILDSGVSKPVIFNLSSQDSVEINHVEKILIRGLGDGDPLEVLYSRQNRFKLGKLYSPNEDLFIVYNDELDFSSKLGIPVHGLIGHSILKDFVVTVDYVNKRLTFTKPDKYKYKKCRKCETFDLEFYKNKPYIQGLVKVIEPMNKELEVKLLIDSGGSDSIWLFEDNEIKTPSKSFHDFIGEGLSGSIYGKRSRLKSFTLKSFIFNNPNVAYLDSLSTLHAKKFKERNGSIGGNILKRFKVIFDYPKSKVTFKKNSKFSEKFGYNLSGIEFMHFGKELVKQRDQTAFTVSKDNETKESNTVSFDYSYSYEFKSIYKIYQVRKGSSAAEAGIMKDDIIVKINGIYVYNYDLQQLTRKFHGKEGRSVRLQVNRNGEILNFEFKLKDILK